MRGSPARGRAYVTLGAREAGERASLWGDLAAVTLFSFTTTSTAKAFNPHSHPPTDSRPLHPVGDTLAVSPPPPCPTAPHRPQRSRQEGHGSSRIAGPRRSKGPHSYSTRGCPLRKSPWSVCTRARDPLTLFARGFLMLHGTSTYSVTVHLKFRSNMAFTGLSTSRWHLRDGTYNSTGTHDPHG